MMKYNLCNNVTETYVNQSGINTLINKLNISSSVDCTVENSIIAVLKIQCDVVGIFL